MQQTCKQCQTAFEISQNDLAFYVKVSPVVGEQTFSIPPPSLCPDCRQRRRMSFRNERHLYRRTCDVTGQNIVSVFAPDSPHKICEKNHWYSDAFDPFDFGRPYDFSVPFFEQFRRLLLDMPLPSLRVELSENCEFNTDMRECKNCYLCARTHQSQNMLYTYHGSKCNDCIDCTQVKKSTFLYECVECVNCQDSRYLFFCNDCANCSFLLDCRNCMDCFMCCNLRGKRFCFLNEQLTREQYQAKLKEFDFGSMRMVRMAHEMYRGIRQKAIRRNLMNIQCENVTGDNLFHCKNCLDCFGVLDSSDGRYLYDVNLYRDAMDAYTGGRDSELVYETTSAAASYDTGFCVRTSNCQRIRYSFFINSSKDIFGSIGLRQARYCILNKQYGKEEYEKLLSKILNHMRSTGEFGEFFPASCSPFPYNDTAAQEYFPLTKSQAIALGYRWQKEEPKVPKEQISSSPDSIDGVKDDIISRIFACETCGKNFKIVPQELTVYRSRRIPLPLQCPDCRYAARHAEQNPRHLRDGICAKCGKKMKTTLTPDRPERIYCEECYRKEIY
ncbi:MAG: hypothetical protein PHE68_03085 [Candidatus Peribacteraceae bacterium]|nr:hypothetical protein [Candidatus Peribacteraceae bacterium]MDD5074249.1 hypothetical protein [Candidatus Peribacteraceae bacterium]